MKATDIREAEQLNLVIINGSKAYTAWMTQNGLPEYLGFLMLELLMHPEITQKQLVELTGYPKQSINKGVKKLLDQHFLQQTVDPLDNRIKRCSLTTPGRKFAEKKLQPLIEIEDTTARKLGTKKMQQLIALNEEWNSIFWHEIRKRGIK